MEVAVEVYRTRTLVFRRGKFMGHDFEPTHWMYSHSPTFTSEILVMRTLNVSGCEKDGDWTVYTTVKYWIKYLGDFRSAYHC
jgi:hypothetical protein